MTIKEEILELERRIRDLTSRMPAHSIKPGIIQKSEELNVKKKTEFSFIVG